MKMTSRASLLILGIASGLWAAGCGSSLDSPTRPPDSPGATIQGTVNAGSAASGAAVGAMSANGNIKVTVVGSGLSTTTDASGKFVLAGVSAEAVTLRFEGPGIDARLDVSGLAPGQVLTITVQASGSNATLVTSSPSPSATPSPGGTEADFKGRIESITPPSLRVAGRTVLTNSSTKIKRDGQSIALSDLEVGQTVEVEGIAQPDGSVLAVKIATEDNNDDDEGEVEFSGKIDSITPPSLTVAGRAVLTDSSTRIEAEDERISLGDLKVGQTVEVKGVAQSNARILARRIKVENEDEGEDEEDDED